MANYKNSRTTQVWNDLEAYIEFCRDYGYRYNPEDLYNNKKYPYQQYRKFQAGKNCKNMWDEDAKRFAGHSPHRSNKNNPNQSRAPYTNRR